jgi:hypothetical protein
VIMSGLRLCAGQMPAGYRFRAIVTTWQLLR